jgi:hypothetical protein
MKRGWATRHAIRRTWATPVLALFAASAWGQGLWLGSDSALGPRVQARVGLNVGAAPADGSAAPWQPPSGVFFGDYYFSRTRLGEGKVNAGFRATSGLMLGQRSQAMGTPALSFGSSLGLTTLRQARGGVPGIDLPPEPWAAVPYVGVGWSGASLKGGWGVSADFGFAGRSDAGLRITGVQSLDDVLRELRLTPMALLGVSYAF